MKEVMLNDKCAHCNHKECHNGEHFCNQAMKENSFYKNAKLYKGLEVIQRPTYEELEKQNAELKADNDARKFAMTMSEKVEKQLRNERNTFLAQNEQYEKDLIDFNENLTKAKEIIRDLLSWEDRADYDYNEYEDIKRKAENILKEE